MSIFNAGNSIEKQTKVFHDTFYNAVKYSKKEFEVLEELVKLRDESSTLFLKSYFELDSKKEKLFKTGDFSKAGIPSSYSDIPRLELIENKAIAKQIMVHDVLGDDLGLA